MLTTFKSPAGPNVLMFEDVASLLIAVMGKSDEQREGIVTVEQMPAVLARLRALTAPEVVTAVGSRAAPSPAVDRRDSISLATRAQPLIGLLELAQRAGQPVVWG